MWRCTTRGGFQGEGIAIDAGHHAEMVETRPTAQRNGGVGTKADGHTKVASKRKLWREGSTTVASPFFDCRFRWAFLPRQNGGAVHIVCDLFRRPLGNLLSGTRDIQLDKLTSFSFGATPAGVHGLDKVGQDS